MAQARPSGAEATRVAGWEGKRMTDRSTEEQIDAAIVEEMDRTGEAFVALGSLHEPHVAAARCA
jgi:hypothetical protein